MDTNRVTYEIFSSLEKKWLAHYENSSTKTRVLSIDGGGTTGIVSGASLIHLEDQIQAKTGDSNARIIDFFDIVAGTGIGAFFAVMLNVDDGNGRPLFNAREVVKFLDENRKKMYKVKNVGFLRRKKMFSSTSMEKVLKNVLSRENGHILTLKDMCKPILIPCFDLNSSAPFVFSRADALESDSYDFDLWKVIRATSGDPSMFKPFSLSSVDGKTACVAIDGGLVMNNPSSIAITHVLHNKREFESVSGVEDLMVLSIGNGLNISSRPKLDSRGRCDKSAVVGIVLDGVSETIDQMLANSFCWNHADYVRIQSNCYINGNVGPKMEQVLMEKGVETLPFGAKRLLTETNGKRIENFVQRVVSSRRNSLPPSPCKDAAVSPIVYGR
uniref:probable inactive patatin-like protein 9 n=1 Tax=Erigeron canadensis TaxID=72917 RepID=UPI001CB94C38|nr:probable inactive patatin-like protein 9 [Erigeron canadensis]